MMASPVGPGSAATRRGQRALELVSLIGRRSAPSHQGPRSSLAAREAGYMTAADHRQSRRSTPLHRGSRPYMASGPRSGTRGTGSGGRRDLRGSTGRLKALRDTICSSCAATSSSIPVRASMVRHPSDWPWSFYRATAGLEPSSTLADDPLGPGAVWRPTGRGAGCLGRVRRGALITRLSRHL